MTNWTIAKATVLDTIGDINPVEYGGGYVLDSGDGPWIEYFSGLDCEDTETLQVYRVPVPDHVWDVHDWATREMSSMADTVGMDVAELRALGHSLELPDRVYALEVIALTWGWEKLDHYPLHLTEAELLERWETWKD